MYSVLGMRQTCWPVVHRLLEHTTADTRKMLVYSAHVSLQTESLGCVMYWKFMTLYTFMLSIIIHLSPSLPPSLPLFTTHRSSVPL